MALAALWALWLSHGPAYAVVLATADGEGNTAAPSADPGFANVGVMNGLSGVYVRNGWVLTAAHVGAHPIELGGATYTPIAGSTVRFANADGSDADLIAFKLSSTPPLPDLLITNDPPKRNARITLIGHGRDRGDPTRWMDIDGWRWGAGRTMRWGTNRIDKVSERTLDTESFWIFFDDPSSPEAEEYEADIVAGDSGGAAFVGSGESAELVGILFARTIYPDQPTATSLFGNGGVAADLHVYREQILGVIDRPACGNGLDDDGDGQADHPDDPGCSSPTDPNERELELICDNGLDDDGDGLRDTSDPGCNDPSDPDERGADYQCDNGLDDDGDGRFDYPADEGCLHPTNLVEAPEPGLPCGLGIGLAALAGLRRRRAPRRGGRGRGAGRGAQSSARSTR